MKTHLWKGFLIFALIFTIIGCSHSPDTLEEYIDNNPKVKEEIQQNNITNEEYNLEIITKRNTLIYNFKFKQQFDKETIELIKKGVKETDDELEEQMSLVAKTLEEETGIEDIRIEVNYLSADGSPLFKGIYKSK